MDAQSPPRACPSHLTDHNNRTFSARLPATISQILVARQPYSEAPPQISLREHQVEE